MPLTTWDLVDGFEGHLFPFLFGLNINSPSYKTFASLVRHWSKALPSTGLVKAWQICLYLHLFGLKNSRCQQMFQSWEPLLHRETYQAEDHDEAQVEVSHDGPAHQSSSFVLTMDAGWHPKWRWVWPRDALKLVPPRKEAWDGAVAVSSFQSYVICSNLAEANFFSQELSTPIFWVSNAHNWEEIKRSLSLVPGA